MRIEVTFKRFPVNVQEFDSKLSLSLSKGAADYAPIFPPTRGLDIKFQDFAFRRQSQKIDWPLFDKRRVNITTTPKQPSGGDEF